MKRWLVLLMLLIQAVFAVGAEAAIQVPPKPSVSSGIYVQDYAGVLSPQTRQALNAIGQDLDNKTTAQVAVVTVKTLDGQPIDEYGLTLLRQWGLGNKEKNNGALILVAVDDRQSRIEVGYGLEGVLPDGLTGRIQDQQMLPYFKQGQYEKGIVQGYLTVATTVAKSYDVKLEGVRYNGGAQQGTGDTPMPGWMKALIAVGLIVLVIVDHMFFGGIITQFILLALLRGGGRGGGPGRRYMLFPIPKPPFVLIDRYIQLRKYRTHTQRLVRRVHLFHALPWNVCVTYVPCRFALVYLVHSDKLLSLELRCYRCFIV